VLDTKLFSLKLTAPPSIGDGDDDADDTEEITSISAILKV